MLTIRNNTILSILVISFLMVSFMTVFAHAGEEHEDSIEEELHFEEIDPNLVKQVKQILLRIQSGFLKIDTWLNDQIGINFKKIVILTTDFLVGVIKLLISFVQQIFALVTQ